MSRTRQFLASDNITRYLVIFATVLTSPVLFHGFEADDRAHRAATLNLPASVLGSRTPFDLFTFYDGNPENTKRIMEYGLAPWWTDPNLRVAFFRPISSLLLWCDHHVLKHPFLIHAHSLLWYMATIAIAVALYRRFIREAWIVGLAGLMFAVDHSHGMAAGWIAQRNTLIAGLFGLLALYFHDRARRDAGRARDAVIASVCLGLGLFSGEALLGVLPYLFVHAITFDRPRWFRALLPYAPPLALWLVIYKIGNYGAHGSGLYIDPMDAPLAYLTNVLQAGPLLVATELGLLGADFYQVIPPLARVTIVIVAVFLIALFLTAVRPLLRLEPTTQFFVFGSMLSVLPACATTPSARLLFFASFGILGVLAQIVAAWRDGAAWFPASGLARLRSMVIVIGCGLGHVFLSPLLFLVSTHQTMFFEDIVSRLSAGIPDDPAIASQRMLVVNPPGPAFLGLVKLARADQGKPIPNKALGFASGLRALELTRTGQSTVVLSSKVGLVLPSDGDLLTRGSLPFVPHGVVELSDLSIEVTKINEDGWPVEVKFSFAHPLEHIEYRWMQWQNQTLAPLALPKIGETISFPGQTMQFL